MAREGTPPADKPRVSVAVFNLTVTRRRVPPSRHFQAFLGRVASMVTDNRRRLGWSKADLGRRTGMSAQMVGAVEAAGANPSLRVLVALLDGLGLDVELVARGQPVVLTATPRQRDAAHAVCSGHAQRRIETLEGWDLRREVRIDSGRYHGWIDLLAFHAESGTLVIIEIKTSIDDLGGIERNMDWYVREAPSVASRLGWDARVILPWLLVLATDEVEARLRANRVVVDAAFPVRAPAMTAILADPASAATVDAGRRGLALIDPRSRRRSWLIRSRIDGRRSNAPYRDYTDFLRRP